MGRILEFQFFSITGGLFFISSYSISKGNRSKLTRELAAFSFFDFERFRYVAPHQRPYSYGRKSSAVNQIVDAELTNRGVLCLSCVGK